MIWRHLFCSLMYSFIKYFSYKKFRSPKSDNEKPDNPIYISRSPVRMIGSASCLHVYNRKLHLNFKGPNINFQTNLEISHSCTNKLSIIAQPDVVVWSRTVVRHWFRDERQNVFFTRTEKTRRRYIVTSLSPASLPNCHEELRDRNGRLPPVVSGRPYTIEILSGRNSSRYKQFVVFKRTETFRQGV